MNDNMEQFPFSCLIDEHIFVLCKQFFFQV